MDFYIEADLIVLLKGLGRYDSFHSIHFNIGPFEWTMALSIGYKFQLILVKVPSEPREIKQIEFMCTVSLEEIGKSVPWTKIKISRPTDYLTINSMTHYFSASDIQQIKVLTYKLQICRLNIVDVDGQNVTDLFLQNHAGERTQSERIWTSLADRLRPLRSDFSDL